MIPLHVRAPGAGSSPARRSWIQDVGKPGILRASGAWQDPACPANWELLSPGDAALTRRVKAAGPTWTIQEKKGRKTFSRGVWAPAERIAAIRADLEAERLTVPTFVVGDRAVVGAQPYEALERLVIEAGAQGRL